MKPSTTFQKWQQQNLQLMSLSSSMFFYFKPLCKTHLAVSRLFQHLEAWTNTTSPETSQQLDSFSISNWFIGATTILKLPRARANPSSQKTAASSQTEFTRPLGELGMWRESAVTSFISQFFMNQFNIFQPTMIGFGTQWKKKPASSSTVEPSAELQHGLRHPTSTLLQTQLQLTVGHVAQGCGQSLEFFQIVQCQKSGRCFFFYLQCMHVQDWYDVIAKTDY